MILLGSILALILLFGASWAFVIGWIIFATFVRAILIITVAFLTWELITLTIQWLKNRKRRGER